MEQQRPDAKQKNISWQHRLLYVLKDTLITKKKVEHTLQPFLTTRAAEQFQEAAAGGWLLSLVRNFKTPQRKVILFLFLAHSLLKQMTRPFTSPGGSVFKMKRGKRAFAEAVWASRGLSERSSPI